ncbi:MAG: hypothetical protein NUV86_09555 [Candidatus Scalindua sp.]|nr:hypothetical protein [Candidatus Scalindua sp.]
MKITCDSCKKTDKRSYSTFFYEKKLMTLCYECRYGVPVPRNTISPNAQFNKYQIPFWKLMGQKPKPKDIAYEKYLKHRGMTYGDAVRERNRNAQNPSAAPKLEKFLYK